MAFTQVLPIGNRSGSVTSAGRVIPAAIAGATIRLDRDAGDRWQAGQGVYIFIDVSFDGGTTWQRRLGSRFDGPLPEFAKNGTDPFVVRVTLGVPQDAAGTRATHFRAGWDVTGGPVRFGVSAEVDH